MTISANPLPPKCSWRSALEKSQPLVLPGAYDALTARLIERMNFDAMVVGGYSLVAARYGLPDIGLVGLGEMVDAVRPILSTTALPVLVDADNGYGDVKNVTRTVRTYESMGAAAILLEDQVSPKRCGHMAGKEIVSAEKMVENLRAAVAERQDPEFFIIARTDARGVHGLDEALRRGERYLKAGADGLFVEAPQSAEELEIIARTFDVPQVCNMLVGGITPILPDAELAAMGYDMIFHATDLIMRSVKVMTELLQRLKRNEPCPAQDFENFAGFQDLLGLDEWKVLEARASQT